MKTSKFFYVVAVIAILSPCAVMFLSSMPGVVVWVYAWLSLWGIFYTRQDDLTKGLVLIVCTCWITIAGRALLEDSETLLNAVQNMMLLISGGVGGNFIYAHLARLQKGAARK